MKRTNILIIILIGLLCTANNCKRDDCHNAIPFDNNSDKTLYVYPKRNYYIDTTLRFADGNLTDPSNERYKVLPYSVSNTCISMRKRNCFDVFETVFIFVLDEEVVATMPWNIIQKDYLILRRYDLTPEDLQLLDWEVPYPPDERMKNMKMYPPYGSE